MATEGVIIDYPTNQGESRLFHQLCFKVLHTQDCISLLKASLDSNDKNLFHKIIKSNLVPLEAFEQVYLSVSNKEHIHFRLSILKFHPKPSQVQCTNTLSFLVETQHWQLIEDTFPYLYPRFTTHKAHTIEGHQVLELTLEKLVEMGQFSLLNFILQFCKHKIDIDIVCQKAFTIALRLEHYRCLYILLDNINKIFF